MAVAIFLLSGCRTLGPPEDAWFGRDKGLHFVGSAILAGTAYSVLANNQENTDSPKIPIAFAFSISAGVAKESYDLYVSRSYWSCKDFAWDILGAAAGCAIAASEH